MLWKSILHQLMLCFTVAITTGFLERHPAKHLFWALSVIYFISLKVNQISKVLYLSSLYVNTTYIVLITTLIKVCWLHWQLFSKWENHLVISKGKLTGTTITLIGGLKKHLLDEPWLLLIRLSLLLSHMLVCPLPVLPVCPPQPLPLMQLLSCILFLPICSLVTISI